MQSATFELVVEELDQRFIEALKALFSGKRVKISVTENAFPGLAEIVATNRRAETIHQFSAETLAFLTEKMTSEENFDLAGELETYRVSRS